jgi:serine/threonine protein kinase
MGSVWRARHRTLGRSFAIKFLKTTIVGGESLERRFLAEARMAASVQHRFVVDMVDFGVSADGIPFMVMEFLQGESLERRCRRLPPLPVIELLRMGAELLLGLEAVHQAGIVHRDLKPENIVLVQEADGTIPKLVDFGISCLEVEPPDHRRITQPGAVLGTPWYMSPEQARRDQTDRHSDIYSVGVILYEALAGVPPFDHPEMSALLAQVRAGGARPLRARRPELGDELSAVIERAMAFAPSARFESAAQMAARLLELAGQLPATLECASSPAVSRTDTEVIERAPRRRTEELDGPIPTPRAGWRRDRVVAAAGALVAAALLTWAAMKERPMGPTAPSEAQASVVLPPAPAASAQETEPLRPDSARARTTLSSTVPAPTPAPEERRRPRRASAHGDRRDPERVALPEVFRTPGF